MHPHRIGGIRSIPQVARDNGLKCLPAAAYYLIAIAEFDVVTRLLNFGELVTALEGQEAFNVGVLSGIKAQSWKEMNSFTHTGRLQVVRRITSTKVESMYPEEEVIGTLDFADSVAFWSALAIVDVVLGDQEEKEKLATQLLERMEQFAKQ